LHGVAPWKGRGIQLVAAYPEEHRSWPRDGSVHIHCGRWGQMRSRDYHYIDAYPDPGNAAQQAALGAVVRHGPNGLPLAPPLYLQ
jgi:hypothetical protein